MSFVEGTCTWKRRILLALLFGCHPAAAPHFPLELVVEVIAIALPPAAMAAIALRSLYETGRVSCSDMDLGGSLSSLASEFVALQANKNRMTIAESAPQFKRLVLRTEDLLANESRQWWVLMRCRG